MNPFELLAKIDIEEYLDQLDHILGLVPGERLHLVDLLRSQIPATSGRFDKAPSQQCRDICQLNGMPVVNAQSAQRDQAAIMEFRQRKPSVAQASGQFALGNILVASDQITRSQLESALLSQVASGRRLGEELVEAGHTSKPQIEGGLLLQKALVAYALSVAAALAPPLATMAPSAEAAQARAVMPVSVTVIANTRMQTMYQATQLEVTSTDIARGYVTIPEASRFSVATNSRSGYLMEFHPLGDFFESVNVDGLGNDIRLGAEGGTIVQRGGLHLNQTHALSFRFKLRPRIVPGLYPWPLQLSVRAL